jgi:hypothetical protein
MLNIRKESGDILFGWNYLLYNIGDIKDGLDNCKLGYLFTGIYDFGKNREIITHAV